MSLAKQVANLPHPPSAMNFNGVYLEDEISGYYTESVEGRYNSSIEITDRSITGVDGSEFVRKRYETRSLDVKYSIYADTKIELHTKESQVKQYTREAEAKIIFDDEPQYYWIGTVSEIKSEGIDATGSGIWVSTGTITITLNDPYKYSTVRKEFRAFPNKDGYMEMIIKNEGTAPVPIDYTIVHGSGGSAENGYIGIVSSEGIIQLGNINETDYASETKSWDTTIADTIMTFDDVLNAPNDPRQPVDQAGMVVDLNMGTSKEDYYDGSKKNILYITNVGADTGSYETTERGYSGVLHWDGYTHLAQKTVRVRNDSTGKNGSTSFYAWFDHWFEAGAMGQVGWQSIEFLTEDNRVIAEIAITKYDQNGNSAKTYFYLNGQQKNVFDFITANDQNLNPYMSRSGMDDFYKDGPNARFYFWGSYYSYSDPVITNMACTKVRFRLGHPALDTANTIIKHYNTPMEAAAPYPITRNYIREFFMRNNPSTVHHSYTYTYNVVNRYQPGCTIQIDGNKAQVYVDGLPKASEEVTGSKYFLAPPGESKIEIHVSPFCITMPTCKAIIREKFL